MVSTLSRWKNQRDFGVWDESRSKRIIPDWAVASLEKQLEEPSGGFQRYTQIQNWLNELLGVQAEYATVHHATSG
ncbi:MAG TPA: hypothetical protein VE944_11710 [Nostoc sp.]|nr:hypothetical protein [Nostoc sp.]